MIDEKLQNILDRLPFNLNEKQLAFLDYFINNKGNMLLQAQAGAGKSLLLKILKQYYEEEIAIFATTGVASQNLKESYGTAHAYLSIPTKPAEDFDYKKVSPKCSGLFASSDKVKIIAIDEAFLLNSDNLDIIYHRIERFNRKYKKRSRRNIRLLLVGDSGQSVTIAKKDLKEKLKERWGSHLMFRSDVWGKFNFEYAVLDKVERQSDKVYKACLDVIRYNQAERFDRCLSWLNQRYRPAPEGAIYLAAQNKVVDKINEDVINSIDKPKFHFPAIVRKKFDLRESLVRENGVTVCETLKVMTIVNDEYERFSNGSTGVVTQVDTEGCYILFDHSGKEERVELYEWENKERYYEDELDKETGEYKPVLKEKVHGSLVCLPVLPSAAISISKSQGLTISVPYTIDLGEDWLYTWRKLEDFGTNFLYLGLSRGVDIDNVYLKRRVNTAYIKVCQDSIDFYKECERNSVI